MHISGGSYYEVCHRPQWKRIFGSGGRAAAAVAGLSNTRNTFHTYAHADWKQVLEVAAETLHYDVKIADVPAKISWEYLYPGAKPLLFPEKKSPNAQALLSKAK
jgi:hypothetical protein